MAEILKELSRRTKIVCTVGPASQDEAVLADLIRGGMDVARLNFAHGTHEEHAVIIERIRAIAKQLGRPVAILQDLPGSKVRLGTFEGGAAIVRTGDTFTITAEPVEGTAWQASTTYPGLVHHVRVGDLLLADDGLIELRVIEKDEVRIHCEVVTGGILRSHKGITPPCGRIQADALTEKDLQDLRFGIAGGVDYVGTSFVTKADDIVKVKQFLEAEGADIPIIAKLEKPEAINHLQEILRVAGGIMVARGDLGLEMRLEDVPVLQKEIMREARRFRVPVIVATQMLESMVEHPRPTRAEASDVANAIFDGTDAVMLSAETATGAYPVQAVEIMARIAARAEQALLPLQGIRSGDNDWTFPEVISEVTVRAADLLKARAIVAFTQTGRTARLISQERPDIPILALTPLEESVRRMALYWGVVPMLIERKESTLETVQAMEGLLRQEGWVKTGDVVAIVSGTPMWEPGTVNALKLHRIGEGR